MFLEKWALPRSFGRLKSVQMTYLVGLESLDSLLLLLLAENDEWATVFVECKTHIDCVVMCYERGNETWSDLFLHEWSTTRSKLTF